MAQLAALYDEKGEWDVFVVEGLHRGVLDRVKNKTDVLGRALPDWTGARAQNCIKPSDAVRVANHLKGLSKDRRKRVFEEEAARASSSYYGTQA